MRYKSPKCMILPLALHMFSFKNFKKKITSLFSHSSHDFQLIHNPLADRFARSIHDPVGHSIQVDLDPTQSVHVRVIAGRV